MCVCVYSTGKMAIWLGGCLCREGVGEAYVAVYVIEARGGAGWGEVSLRITNYPMDSEDEKRKGAGPRLGRWLRTAIV